MECGQQVLHASCCLTHCSAPGRLQSGAFPISKVRQARSFIHLTRKRAFRHNFFGRFTAACVARGGGREPDKGGLLRRTISARRPTTRGREKFGGMEVSEAKRLRALEEENSRIKRLVAEVLRGEAKYLRVGKLYSQIELNLSP
jgi:hypothetical protein